VNNRTFRTADMMVEFHGRHSHLHPFANSFYHLSLYNIYSWKALLNIQESTERYVILRKLIGTDVCYQ